MKTVILLFALVQPLLFAAGQTHPCSSDVTNDGHVDVHDLLSMFAEFGSVGSYGTDTNDDGMVNVNDLLDILSSYGTKCDVLQEMYQCSELKPLFHENQCSCLFESDTRCTAIRSAFDICGCADSSASHDSVSVLPKIRTQRTTKTCPEVEVVQTSTDGNGTTYQLSLVLGGDQENVYAIYGTEDHPMSFPASFQEAAPFGANVGGANSVFWSITPGAEFDGWLTVGPTGGDTAGALGHIGVDFDAWTDESVLSVENGAVFRMDPDSGPGGSVGLAVVAQITVAGSFSVTLNAQGRSTAGVDWYCEDLTFQP